MRAGGTCLAARARSVDLVWLCWMMHGGSVGWSADGSVEMTVVIGSGTGMGFCVCCRGVVGIAGAMSRNPWLWALVMEEIY